MITLRIGNDEYNWITKSYDDKEFLLALAKWSAIFLHCEIALVDDDTGEVYYHNGIYN